ARGPRTCAGASGGSAPGTPRRWPSRRRRSRRVVVLLVLVGLGLRVDAGFLALLGRDGRGCRGQRVVAATGLREGDDLADRVGTREQRDRAVPAERDAAVRRRAVLERVEQEAELLLGLLGADAHDLEDALLHVLAVDTDRAATDLVAVADDVVGLGQRVAGRGQRLGVLGRGERVMHRGPLAAADGHVTGVELADGLEHRPVDHEREGPLRLVDEVLAAGDLDARGAEQLARALDR